MINTWLPLDVASTRHGDPKLALAIKQAVHLSFFGDSQSQSQAVSWLHAALQHGHFSLPSLRATESNLNPWMPWEALFGFLHLKEYPVCEAIPSGSLVSSCMDFRDVYCKIVDNVLEQLAKSKDRKGKPILESQLTFCATLLAGACALDMRETVEAIARFLPESMQHPVQIVERNEGIWHQHNDWKHIQTTCYFVAIQYSSMSAINALWRAGLPADAPLGWTLDKPPSKKKSATPPPFAQRLNVISAWTEFKPCANADTLSAVVRAYRMPVQRESIDLKIASEMDAYAANLATDLCKQMSVRMAWLTSRIPTLLAAGLFDAKPTEAVRVACRVGQPAVVAHFADRIDWEELLLCSSITQFLTSCSAASSANKPSGAIENALCALVTAAQGVGIDPFKVDILETVLTRQHDREPALQPVTNFGLAGYTRLLDRFMQNGFDPNESHGDVASLIDSIKVPGEHFGRMSAEHMEEAMARHHHINPITAMAGVLAQLFGSSPGSMEDQPVAA